MANGIQSKAEEWNIPENQPQTAGNWRYGAAVFSVWTQLMLVVIIALVSINFCRSSLQNPNSSLKWNLRNLSLKFHNPKSLAKRNFNSQDLRLWAIPKFEPKSGETPNFDFEHHPNWQWLATKFGIKVLPTVDSAPPSAEELRYLQTARRFIVDYNSCMVRLVTQNREAVGGL